MKGLPQCKTGSYYNKMIEFQWIICDKTCNGKQGKKKLETNQRWNYHYKTNKYNGQPW